MNWLSYSTPVHSFFHCILIQCATSKEVTESFSLASEISVGKTALARELRKSVEPHKASRGKLLWTKQRNCITLPGYWTSQLSSLPVMGFLQKEKVCMYCKSYAHTACIRNTSTFSWWTSVRLSHLTNDHFDQLNKDTCCLCAQLDSLFISRVVNHTLEHAVKIPLCSQ